jgi:acetyltransferase-like isoleucine patch superfamily enzyme
MLPKIIRKVKFTYHNLLSCYYVRYDISSKAIVDIEKLKFGQKWSFKNPNTSLLVIRENASINVKNKFRIYSGAKIYVNKEAELTLGRGYINHNLNLSCFEKIEIGNNVSISENLTIRDSDNHIVIFDGQKSIKTQPIKIGNHVWIGVNVTILNGVTIGDNSVVAAGSVVTSSFQENTLIGGVPAKIIKNNICWE